jgi:hypothetical protein
MLAMLSPTAALPCPVCFSNSSERVMASYVLTAGFMTALPLLIVGVFALWLRRRFRAAGMSPSGDCSPEPSGRPQSCSA